jgi:hypothetical protein
MSQHHLSDTQIQSYLDNNTGSEISHIETHLRQCSRCRLELDLYRELYLNLEKDVLPALPADFATKVISGLPVKNQSRWEKIESGFMVAIILISLAVSFYFINPLTFLSETGSSILHKLPAIGIDLFARLNGNLPFVLIALLIFFIVEVFDKKLLKPKL